MGKVKGKGAGGERPGRKWRRPENRELMLAWSRQGGLPGRGRNWTKRCRLGRRQ